jgi:ubiquinone/menaquinone biosynthesis C-methylase UbiE
MLERRLRRGEEKEKILKKDYCVGDYIYDAQIYDGFNKQNDDLEFYINFFSTHNITKVLELCCGTGRLTIPLYESGIKITGLDLNKSMLNEALKKIRNKGYQIPLINGDMRTFNIDGMFEAIFIPFNSIHHLYLNEDLYKTLNTIRKHLTDNGYLIIDYFNPSIRYISENEKHSVKIADYKTEDGRKVVINQTMHYEDDSQINRIKWQYIINDQIHSNECLDMRIFYPKELDSYIECNNYKIVKKYGDYNLSEFMADSPKQLIICQKNL